MNQYSNIKSCLPIDVNDEKCDLKGCVTRIKYSPARLCVHDKVAAEGDFGMTRHSPPVFLTRGAGGGGGGGRGGEGSGDNVETAQGRGPGPGSAPARTRRDSIVPKLNHPALQLSSLCFYSHCLLGCSRSPAVLMPSLLHPVLRRSGCWRRWRWRRWRVAGSGADCSTKNTVALSSAHRSAVPFCWKSRKKSCSDGVRCGPGGHVTVRSKQNKAPAFSCCFSFVLFV